MIDTIAEIKTIRWDELKRSAKCAAALGNFDGVHLGHKQILDRLLECSRKTGLEPVIVTFYPHPRLYLKQDRKFGLLTAPWEKAWILEREYGCQVYFLEFDRDFSNLLPHDFVQKFLKNILRARMLVLGPDYRFGFQAKGDVKFLQSHFYPRQNSVEIVPQVKKDRETISSTIIREYLGKGDIRQANCLLGRSFFYTGIVVKGDGRGRKLGYPTVNLDTRCREKLMLPPGVYGATALSGSERHPAVVSVGINPTFSAQKTKIEAHILDFKQDIYGQNITLELNSFLRNEMKFNSGKELAEQINKDIKNFKETIKKGE
jgi:riboflavin kinase/FMN adenylyltransferase